MKKREPVKQESSAPLTVEEVSKPTLGDIPENVPSMKVALLVPLSGESASIGNTMFDAASMALYDSYVAVPSDKIKTQLVLIPKDTGVTATETAQMAQQAVEQGASFVIGPLFSQSVTSVKPVLADKKITMLSFSNNKSVAAPNVYTFGVLPEQQVERIAEHAYLSKFQRVALLAPNDAYGEKVRDTLSDVYLRKGGQVFPSELFASSQANIDAAVTRISSAYNNSPEDRRFQAIFIADSGAQMPIIIKALKKNIDLKRIKIFGTGVWDDEALLKIPELAGAQFPSPPPELYEKFETRFKNAYGYKPVRLAGLAYDAVTIAAHMAIDGNGINEAEMTTEEGFNTPAGGLVRLLKNGTSERKLAIMEVTPDGFKVIDRVPRSFSDE